MYSQSAPVLCQNRLMYSFVQPCNLPDRHWIALPASKLAGHQIICSTGSHKDCHLTLEDSMNPTTFDQVFLAVDIHDVLAETKADEATYPLFKAYGMVVQVAMEDQTIPHYVYPGVKEFLQLAVRTPGMHLAFFTSSEEKFAYPFVKVLLTETLGEAGYEQVAGRIKVCAKDKLRKFDSYEGPFPDYKKYEMYRGNCCKDLVDAFPDAPIGQTLLIDDQSSYAAPHQLKNIFQVSGSGFGEECRSRKTRGSHYLYYLPSDEKPIENQISEGRAIVLRKTGGYEGVGPKDQSSYVISYLGSNGREKLHLTVEQFSEIQDLHNKLFLKEYFPFPYHENVENKTSCEVTKNLRLAISSLFEQNGKNITEKMLVYIAGEQVEEEFCKDHSLENDLVLHLQNHGSVRVYFPADEEQEVQSIEIQESSEQNLLDLVHQKWDLIKKSECFFTKSRYNVLSLALYERVWSLVQDRVWKGRWTPEANHILTIAGVIFRAWEESITTQRSMSEIVFEWQCKEVTREWGGTKETQTRFGYAELHKRRDLCLEGLEQLRKVNPKLQPMTVEHFEIAVQQHPYPTEAGGKRT